MLKKTKKTPHLFHSSSLQFYEAALRHLVVPNGGADPTLKTTTCNHSIGKGALLSQAHKGGAQQTFKLNRLKFIIKYIYIINLL